MALSKSELKRAIDSVPEGHDVGVWVVRVCRAVEAEVRKQDTALIRQLTDLVQAQHDYIMALPADVVASLPAMPGFDGDWADEIKAAARARLESKP